MELEGKADDVERQCIRCGEKIAARTAFMDTAAGVVHQRCFSLGSCGGCSKDLLPTEEIMKAMGVQYHVGCFRCSLCATPITANYLAKDGKPICEGCVAESKRQAEERVRGECGGCQGPVKAADRAVTFGDKMWHLKCFVCHKCSGSLQQGVAEFEGRFYCADCFRAMRTLVQSQAETPAQQILQEKSSSSRASQASAAAAAAASSGGGGAKPKEAITCHGCKAQVTSGRIVRMLGNVWHVDCVKCFHCKEKIVGNQMAEVDNEPHCIPCAKKLFEEKQRAQLEQRRQGSSGTAAVPSAADTSAAVVPRQAIKCSVCNEPVGSEYMELAGEPYCEPCAKMTQKSIQCGGCHKTIDSGVKFKKALQKFWHTSCFSCSQCKSQLDPKNYQTHAGKLVCDEHYESLSGVIAFKCLTCLKRIFGQMVTHDNKSYHPECFVCGKCSKPFPNGEYSRGKSGTLYCRPCFLHGADR